MADEAIKTVAGEITKIAVEHGYNGVAPKTITAAIDALADTLAGSDVDSGQTVAQAVRALAPYIGSGGGVQLGSLQNGIRITGNTPVVDDNDDESEYVGIKSAKAGNIVVFSGDSEEAATAPNIAAGLVVTIETKSYGQPSNISAYVVTKDDEGTYTSVRQWDGQLDVVVGEEDSEGYCDVEVTLTMPELDVDGGETLIIYQRTDLG